MFCLHCFSLRRTSLVRFCTFLAIRLDHDFVSSRLKAAVCRWLLRVKRWSMSFSRSVNWHGTDIFPSTIEGTRLLLNNVRVCLRVRIRSFPILSLSNTALRTLIRYQLTVSAQQIRLTLATELILLRCRISRYFDSGSVLLFRTHTAYSESLLIREPPCTFFFGVEIIPVAGKIPG